MRLPEAVPHFLMRAFDMTEHVSGAEAGQVARHGQRELRSDEDELRWEAHANLQHGGTAVQ